MRHFVIAIGLLGVCSTTTAWAVEPPKSLNEPPRGPGAEQKETWLPVAGRVEPGFEVSGQLGGGAGGFGLGARGGYTMDRGIYLGGSYTHFFGSSEETINGDQRTSRNLFGGDIGYKLFFVDRVIEVRPFVFLGADFFHEFHEDTRSMSSETGFAVHPSILAAYRFGTMYVSGEFRAMITPTPVHVAGFGGFGMAL
jgi:hypothetical protein